MAGPFPGMDPYLESPAYWRDFHQRFLTYWCDWLADHLPDNYEVRLDERVRLVEDEDTRDGSMLPDVSVSQRYPLPDREPAGGVAVLVAAEPTTLRLPKTEADTETQLRIWHRPDNTLVAVLELLSPTNKGGPGRDDYLAKRNELVRDTAHLVEIDLLLGGERLPMRGRYPMGDYFALVSRGDHRPVSEVYAWGLAQPLTGIRLPLRAPDLDVAFDLPGLVELAYSRGRYARSLPYDQPPPAPLVPERLKWVAERVAAWKAARA